MTKTDEALKVMQDYFELERRVKILEIEMREIHEKTGDCLCHLNESEVENNLNDISNITEKYLL